MDEGRIVTSGTFRRVGIILQAGEPALDVAAGGGASAAVSASSMERLREQLVIDYAKVLDGYDFGVRYLLAEPEGELPIRVARIKGWRWASMEARRGNARGGYLGVLARAFVEVESSLILRASSPELSPSSLNELLAALGGADVGVGVDARGRWWGIGVRLSSVGVVERVDWSSAGWREALRRQCAMECAHLAEVCALES